MWAAASIKSMVASERRDLCEILTERHRAGPPYDVEFEQ
jgi:hypothetical protein